jgi:iron complex outermembrane recepter protein
LLKHNNSQERLPTTGNRNSGLRYFHSSISLAIVLALPLLGHAQSPSDAGSKRELKKLSFEELLDLEVTSVSRKPSKFTESAAAIEVITQDRIRRSGVTNLPDALRLATGIHVASSDGHTWAISARGFNGTAANKLQVLLDGRSLYTPLYSGVFWDVQDTLLDDVDRIEIIRGPGATMWGANAVNGVINIITKKAQDTQGALISGGAGSSERAFGGIRYGGRIGDNTYYRSYIKYFDRVGSVFPSGLRAGDAAKLDQGGFRVDSELSNQSSVTVQGDLYTGRSNKPPSRDTVVGGGNVLARWARKVSSESDLQLQFYYDRVDRNTPLQFQEGRNTYDVDLQHRIRVESRHDLVWGVNYRVSSDLIGNSTTVAFIPDHRALQLASGFLQDEVRLSDAFGLTFGSKFEHNTLSGFEVQPSVRMAWYPAPRQTVWAAFSRAARTPSRIDEDFQAQMATGLIVLKGNPDFRSEKALAHELGYRIQPSTKLSFDLATFYNSYRDVRSLEPQGPSGLPLLFQNNLTARTYGAELTANVEVMKWWRVRAGHSYLQTDFRRKPESRALSTTSEGNDPKHLVTVHSSIDLPMAFEFDTVLRYVAQLPNPRVPSYHVMDVRLGWSPESNVEFAVVGQNLLDRQHSEFGTQTSKSPEVKRSVLGRITWRF